MPAKPKPTPEAKKPNLKLVKGTPAEKSLKKQMKQKKETKAKNDSITLAVEAMEHADKALAYNEFTRKQRAGEETPGALVSAAVEFATDKAKEEASEQFSPLSKEQMSGFMRQVMDKTHPFAQLHTSTVKLISELRGRLHGEAIPQRIFDKCDLILGAGSLPVAEKLAQKAYQSAEYHYYAEWARGRILGVPSPERAYKEAKSLESLAKFVGDKGQESRAAQLMAKAEEIRENPAAMVPAQREMDLSKLSKTESTLINYVKNAGGSVTTETLKGGFERGDWSVKDMSRMMDLKVLSTPREGVVRLDESKLMSPEEPPKDKAFGDGKIGAPRKSHAIKTPKDPNAPKKERAPAKDKPIINPEGKCLCGCGNEVKKTSRFGIGHDAKLHSAVLKAAKGDKDIAAKLPLKNETSVAYLKQAPWMTPEVLKAIGL